MSPHPHCVSKSIIAAVNGDPIKTKRLKLQSSLKKGKLLENIHAFLVWFELGFNFFFTKNN